MPSTSPFPAFQLTGRQAVRVERVLAVGRAFLTITALAAIFLDPTEPARLRELTYAVLLSYAFYSLVVLAVVNWAVRLTPSHGRLIHGLDILWSSALTFVSEGPVSPFFLFFLFVVLAAAYRWRFRETVGTTVLIVGIFLAETAVASAGPWHATMARIDVEVNRAILRIGYLVLTGVLLAYLAEQDKRSRAELAAIARAARQPLGNLGLNAAIAAVARNLADACGAAAVVVAVRDLESGKAFCWHWEPDARSDNAPRIRRRELDPGEATRWLFEAPGRAWHAVRDRSGGVTVRSTAAEQWHLVRARWGPPMPVDELFAGDTVTAVTIGLANEWDGRVYLLDAPETGGLEQRLHFLEDLAEHVTPGLTNVFLQRRLRARAGAAERARVARELHDGAIQSLIGIEMKLEALRRRHASSPGVELDELSGIQELLRHEVLALRELMQTLRPTEIDSIEQLSDVLAAQVERFSRDTGIAARFVTAGSRMALSPGRASELVRIVQEALVNVRKHSHARNVLVHLSADGATCRLVIEDDGRGFQFEGRLDARELDQRRAGPTIIKERARVVGAALVVDSMPGTGARVELTIPQDAHA